MIQRLSLKQSSCPADESCVVYCNIEAKLVLKCEKAVLMRVLTSDYTYHFVWADPETDMEIPEYCPIFREDDEDAICEIKDIVELNVNDIFCHHGEAYYLSQNASGTLVIRRLIIYSSQQIVEKISEYDMDAEPVQNINLARLYDLRGGKQFALYCWLVWRESSLNYVPIFEGDDRKLDQLSLSLCQREIMSVGSTFIHNKKVYCLAKDAEDKLFIGTGLKYLLNQREKQSVEENASDKKEKEAFHAKIIPLRCC